MDAYTRLQPSILHMYGFSWVCIKRCWKRLLGVGSSFAQLGHFTVPRLLRLGVATAFDTSSLAFGKSSSTGRILRVAVLC